MKSSPLPDDTLRLPSGQLWDRRAALKLLASGMALGLASCAKPSEEIVPYVEIPERLVPGEPLQFATALPLSGYSRGVLATSIDGRPIKIEGNPRHPASLGSTDIFAESAVLSLYDPDRSKVVRGPQGITSWESFAATLNAQLHREASRSGAGLRILTGRVTSPTLLRQLTALLQKFPQARWYRYEPIDDDAMREGAKLAFGRVLTPRPRLHDAVVMLGLDADPLGHGPDQIQFARNYASRRQSHLKAAEFLRLYAVESTWSLTGANADHRLALPPALIRQVAMSIASDLGASVPAGNLPANVSAFAKLAAADLVSHPGEAMVLAGPGQPAELHALCHWINDKIKAPIDFVEPVDTVPQGHADALAAFADDCTGGKIETLLIIGANPAYDAPGELGLADAIAKLGFSVHLGHYADETASVCHWHLPLSHPLESWSDLRAPDGTASIVQPLIRPLYDTRTAHEVVAQFAGESSASPYDLVRDTWRGAAGGGDFESWWRSALHDGVIAGTAHPIVTPGTPTLPAFTAPEASAPETSEGMTLTLAPDPSIWDGSFGNNAWLQECPKPLTKQVWGNALHVSAADATRLQLSDGDIVRATRNGLSVEGPVLITQGHAEGVISATFGYGRRSGSIARDIGFNVFSLRPRDGRRVLDNLTLGKTGKTEQLLSTQHQFELEGESRDLLRSLPIADLEHHDGNLWPQYAAPPSLYPGHQYDGSAWAMVIDNSLCIGCNACVIACQAENNVPVVGPEEIAAGRDMHWLRIDTYRDEPGNEMAGFEPVPCMHCEHAPCEPVCPVAASVHDGEGLNVQVYNRCIGTRFCQSNCPYKVRRFNFFGYADGQEYANLGAESMKAAKNPEVTVRARGVMEKCTYCVQRISRARRTAEKDDRAIREGEVVTACQAACPTRAIRFGDLSAADSQVNALRKLPHHYQLLGHLGTRPRTTYLARLRNKNPALAEQPS
jgi:molybdopterin-containing oxidoreductase family iron-sulfur binding subunit